MSSLARILFALLFFGACSVLLCLLHGAGALLLALGLAAGAWHAALALSAWRKPAPATALRARVHRARILRPLRKGRAAQPSQSYAA